MKQITLTVKLEGKAQLHQPQVKFEQSGISVNLWSFDGGVTWRNDDATIQFDGALDIFMSCKALTGTGFKFTVREKNTGGLIRELEAETGDPMPHRGGERRANYYELKESIQTV
jgi:hypothetical protein